MYVTNLKLVNFRNYQELVLELDKNVNVFFGNNAAGKTNILEAIYMTAITKSYRTVKENEVIKFGESYSNIFVNYVDKLDRNSKIQLYIDDNSKKKIKEDDIDIKRASDIIGKYNVVIFSPESLDIIKGSPKNRRKFIDVLLSQISKAYLLKLQEYNKVLAIKNSLLKNDSDKIDKDYLDILDEKLADYIKYIIEERKKIIERINIYASKIQNDLTSNKEDIYVKYVSDFLGMDKEEIIGELKRNRFQDLLKKSSTKGVQRDDFEVYINNLEVKIYGSQGQNRTALLTLKLSELEILKDEKEDTPILLLDDVLSELDNNRIEYLLKYIKPYQTVITTTEIDTLKPLCNISFYKVLNGSVEKLKNK